MILLYHANAGPVSTPTPCCGPPADDGWSDDEKKQPEIKYETFEVVSDHIPENKDLLTLQKYDIVYVFKKNPNGIWEGESKGVYGKFPSAHVRPLKHLGK